MKKRIISIIIIIAVLLGLLWFSGKLLMPKYANDIIEGRLISEYYDNAGGNDILFVGDCELYENISPITLWEEYGITSYIRGSSQQLIWQSYYLLEEMLDYETPDMVVFNVLSMKYNEPQKEAYNRLTLDGMKWSSHKWNAIKAVSDFYNINTDMLVAFGDDKNDLEMIKNCGIGVAVKNALDEVKNVAKYICETNNNDGVAKWLEKNILC